MKRNIKIKVSAWLFAFFGMLALPGLLRAEKVAIIDAGSSGSRLYVYEIDAAAATPVQQIFPIGPQQKALSKSVPLSSVVPHADSVKVFLQKITAAYPCDSVPLYVFATAGMRLKPKAQADSVYCLLKELPRINGYFVQEAMTITGQYEGLYAWIATNYANGKIGLSSSDGIASLNYHCTPFGILEIGGASLQMAFPTRLATAQTLYRPGLGYIYSKSFLGAGVDQIYAHTEQGKHYEFNYDFGNDVSYLYDGIITFWSAGFIVNYYLDGVQAQTEKKSYKSKVNAYVRSYDDFVDTTDNYHPRMNAHYVRWVCEKLKLEDNLVQPEKDPSWTVGAALDLLINQAAPTAYDPHSAR